LAKPQDGSSIRNISSAAKTPSFIASMQTSLGTGDYNLSIITDGG
jgi:hypothetical protein